MGQEGPSLPTGATNDQGLGPYPCRDRAALLARDDVAFGVGLRPPSLGHLTVRVRHSMPARVIERLSPPSRPSIINDLACGKARSASHNADYVKLP